MKSDRGVSEQRFKQSKHRRSENKSSNISGDNKDRSDVHNFIQRHEGSLHYLRHRWYFFASS